MSQESRVTGHCCHWDRRRHSRFLSPFSWEETQYIDLCRTVKPSKAEIDTPTIYLVFIMIKDSLPCQSKQVEYITRFYSFPFSPWLSICQIPLAYMITSSSNSPRAFTWLDFHSREFLNIYSFFFSSSWHSAQSELRQQKTGQTLPMSLPWVLHTVAQHRNNTLQRSKMSENKWKGSLSPDLHVDQRGEDTCTDCNVLPLKLQNLQKKQAQVQRYIDEGGADDGTSPEKL